MFFKIAFVVFAIASSALGRPEGLIPEVPPGIFPILCKNYPFCDNEVLARHSIDGLLRPVYTYPGPDADVILPRVNILPHGVDETICPTYPFCNLPVVTPKPVVVEPLPGYSARLYPPGIMPSLCPNYPFCH